MDKWVVMSTRLFAAVAFLAALAGAWAGDANTTSSTVGYVRVTVPGNGGVALVGLNFKRPNGVAPLRLSEIFGTGQLERGDGPALAGTVPGLGAVTARVLFKRATGAGTSRCVTAVFLAAAFPTAGVFAMGFFAGLFAGFFAGFFAGCFAGCFEGFFAAARFDVAFFGAGVLAAFVFTVDFLWRDFAPTFRFLGAIGSSRDHRPSRSGFHILFEIRRPNLQSQSNSSLRPRNRLPQRGQCSKSPASASA